MNDPDSLGRAFVEHYYAIFDSSRAGLLPLYQDHSMLTIEGEKIQGAQQIVSKLTSLPFPHCKHVISNVDCQPSGPGDGILVFVTGALQLPGEDRPLKFSQGLQRLAYLDRNLPINRHSNPPFQIIKYSES